MLLGSSAIAAEIPVSQPVFIPSPGVVSARPVVTGSDVGFLIAWDEGIPGVLTTEASVVKVRTFREDGTSRQAGEVFIARGFGAQAAAWSGSEYVVAYAKPQFVRPFGFRPIAAMTRVSADGRALGKELILASGSSGVVYGLGCDRQQCVATLNVDGRLTLVAFDPTGGVLHTSGVSTRGISNLSVPRTTAAYRLGSMSVWLEDSQVRAVFVPSGESPDRSRGEIISVVAAPQSDGAAVIDGQGLLLAWSERRRVFMGGDAVGDLDASSPRLSVAGSQTLFVRVEQGHLLASRLVARAAQPPPIEVADRAGQPAISTDGHEWLVAWATYDQQVRIASITANGDVLPPGGVAILPSAFQQREPSVAWDGSAFRVAWIEEAEENGVRRVRVTSRLADRSGVPIGQQLSFGDEHPQPSSLSLRSVSLGCRAGACLIVWMHGLQRTFSAASVRSDGALGVEKNLFASDLTQPAVVLPRESGGFEVWHDGRRHAVSPEGDVISSMTWSANDLIVYNVIGEGATAIVLYARSVERDLLGGSLRLFLFLPKLRAVR